MGLLAKLQNLIGHRQEGSGGLRELWASEDDLVYYDEIIRTDPNDALAFAARAVAKRRLGDANGALADCDEAIRLDPNLAEAYGNRGIAKSNLGDFAGAIADYDEVLRRNPNDARAHYNRAAAKSDLGDAEGAIADYDECIRLDPNDARAYYNRGGVRHALGDMAGSIADYDRAIKLDPSVADDARHACGHTGSEWKETIEIPYGSPVWHIGLGIFLLGGSAVGGATMALYGDCTQSVPEVLAWLPESGAVILTWGLAAFCAVLTVMFVRALRLRLSSTRFVTITDTMLSAPKSAVSSRTVVIPLRTIKLVYVHGMMGDRLMTIEHTHGRLTLSQSSLPNPAAFDQIHEATTARIDR